MKNIVFIFIMMTGLGVQAQDDKSVESYDLIGLNSGYGIQIPFGDMADRFGQHFNLGADLDYYTAENSYIIGIAGRFLFGSKVKEDPIDFLRDENGFLTAPGGGSIEVFKRQRGIYFGVHVGKLITLSEIHKLSNLRLTFGAGILQHKIKYNDDSQSLPFPFDPYVKGLDRLTNGLGFHQQIAYQRIDPEGYLSFTLGLELIEGFTKLRRDVDLAGYQESKTRFDMMVGIKATWTLPFFLEARATRMIYY